MLKLPTGIRASLFGGAALAFALINTGCGGTSSSSGVSTPASPFVLGINDASGTEGSGLGLPVSATSPSKTDVAYDTFATAVTPLNGAPAIVTDPTTVTGEVLPPPGNAVAVGTNGVTFRAEIANGQTKAGGVPTITKAVLTSSDPQWTLGTLPVTFQFTPATAAGPFIHATYSTGRFNLPFTTAGPHTVSVTVTDSANQSSRTDFTIQVMPAGNASVQVYQIDTGTKDADGVEVFTALNAGDTATLTGSAGTATADASGLLRLSAVPGKQTLTVNTTDAAKKPITFVQQVDLTGLAGSGTTVDLLAASQVPPPK